KVGVMRRVLRSPQLMNCKQTEFATIEDHLRRQVQRCDVRYDCPPSGGPALAIQALRRAVAIAKSPVCGTAAVDGGCSQPLEDPTDPSGGPIGLCPPAVD